VPDRFRKLEEDSFDVIVIGAGAGGLTAAALLASRGKKVLVLDQHYVAGGNMTAFRRPNYHFDVGLHYVGGCHAAGFLPKILRAVGAHGVDFQPMDPNGFDTIMLPDLVFKVPRGMDNFRARLIEAFPYERAGIERYVGVMRQLLLLQGTVGRPLALLAAVPRVLTLARWSGSTFAEFLDSCTHDPRLRAVLAGQHLDYAQSPSRVSALMGLLLPMHLIESGGYYPRGGGQAVSDALAASVESNGGKLLLRTRARRILVEQGCVKGVVIESKHLGTRVVRAPVVVSNADVKRTYLELVGPEHLATKTVARVEGFEMAPALGSVYLGVRRGPNAESLPCTNFWLQQALDIEEEYRATERGDFASQPSTIVSIASAKDPANTRLAPEGVTNIQLMSLAPSRPEAWGVSAAQVADGTYRDNPAYLEKKAEYAGRLIRIAERTLPRLAEQIVFQEVGTPLTQQRYTLSTGGTSYGIASTPMQFLRRRPDTKSEIRGLYLCGASCRFGHGIAGAMLSGLLAASYITGFRLVRDVMLEKTLRGTRTRDLQAEVGAREVSGC
jgi:all-trans-retinol 13,14-reductase